MAEVHQKEENGETVICLNHNGVVRKFIVPLGALASQEGAGDASLPPIASSPASRPLPAVQPAQDAQSAQNKKEQRASHVPGKKNVKRASVGVGDKHCPKVAKKYNVPSSFADALAQVGKIADQLKKLRSDEGEKPSKHRKSSSERVATDGGKSKSSPSAAQRKPCTDETIVINDKDEDVDSHNSQAHQMLAGAGTGSPSNCRKTTKHKRKTAHKVLEDPDEEKVESGNSAVNSDGKIPSNVYPSLSIAGKSITNQHFHVNSSINGFQNASAPIASSQIATTSCQPLAVGNQASYMRQITSQPLFASQPGQQVVGAQNPSIILNQSGVQPNFTGPNVNQPIVLGQVGNQPAVLNQSGSQPIILSSPGNTPYMVNQTGNQTVIIGNQTNILNQCANQKGVFGASGNPQNVVNQQPFLLGQNMNQVNMPNQSENQPVILSTGVASQQVGQKQNQFVILQPTNQPQTLGQSTYVGGNQAQTNAFCLQNTNSAVNLGNQPVLGNSLTVKQEQSNVVNTVLTSGLQGTHTVIVQESPSFGNETVQSVQNAQSQNLTSQQFSSLSGTQNITNPVLVQGNQTGAVFQSALENGHLISTGGSQATPNSIVLPMQRENNGIGSGSLVFQMPAPNVGAQTVQGAPVQNMVLSNGLLQQTISQPCIGSSVQLVSGASADTSLQQSNSETVSPARTLSSARTSQYAVGTVILQSGAQKNPVGSLNNDTPFGLSKSNAGESLSKKLNIIPDKIRSCQNEVSEIVKILTKQPPKILPKPPVQTDCNMTMAVPLYAASGAEAAVNTVHSTAVPATGAGPVGLTQGRNTAQPVLSAVLLGSGESRDIPDTRVQCEDEEEDDDVLILSPGSEAGTFTSPVSQTMLPKVQQSVSDFVGKHQKSPVSVGNSDGQLVMTDLKGDLKRIFGFTYLNNIRHAVVEGENGFVALPLPETTGTESTQVPDQNSISTSSLSVTSSTEVQTSAQLSSLKRAFSPGNKKCSAPTQHGQTDEIKKHLREKQGQNKRSFRSFKRVKSIREKRKRRTPVVVLHNLNISNTKERLKSYTLHDKFRNIVNCKSRRGLFEKFTLAADGTAVIRERNLCGGKVEKHFCEGTYLRVLKQEHLDKMYGDETDVEEDEAADNNRPKKQSENQKVDCEAKSPEFRLGFADDSSDDNADVDKSHVGGEIQFIDISKDKRDIENSGEDRASCPQPSASYHCDKTKFVDKPPVLQKCDTVETVNCKGKGPPKLHLFCDGKDCAQCTRKTQSETEAASVQNTENFSKQREEQIFTNTMAAFLKSSVSKRVDNFKYFQGILNSFAKRPAILPKPK